MAKVFSFTSVLRKNMMEKDKPDLYYALAKSSGEIDIDEMAERIQRSSTVNWADVVCAACPADRNDRQFQERRDRPSGEYRFVLCHFAQQRRTRPEGCERRIDQRRPCPLPPRKGD
jgi:hypothetical protein